MKLLVYGSSEFGVVVRNMVTACGHEFAGFVDDVHPHNEGVIGAFESVRITHDPKEFGIVLAVGYKHLEARRRIFEKVRVEGYVVPALIHPAAYVCEPPHVGEGSLIMARAIVDCHARIGVACVIWPGANVSHNSTIGANTFLSPNCTVCGFVTIGQGTFVGAGAVIADKRSVPEASFIKAGSVYS